MKIENILLSVVAVLFAHNVFAMVFETDNRIDFNEIAEPEVKALAKSVFTFVLKQDLKKRPDGQFEFTRHDTLQNTVGLCSGERFAEQSSVPTRCSGFLASEDLAVTAGHCVSPVEVNGFCKNYFVVFDYRVHSNGSTSFVLKSSSVYECDKIMSLAYDPHGRTDDYAVLHLSRPVSQHKPLKYRKDGRVSDHETVFMLGFPRGLPEKLSLNRSVGDNTDPSYFSADLDCFHGNSGSPVFDSRTLEVEGIFVRGEGSFPGEDSTNPAVIGDFLFNDHRKCYQTLVCRRSEGCTATMDTTRMTRVPLNLK